MYNKGWRTEGEDAVVDVSFFLPSTQSFSTSVWMLADLRPTQKVDKTSNPTKRTLPACLCTNRPRWNRCHWSFVRSHNAALLPDALPCWDKEIVYNEMIQAAQQINTFEGGKKVGGERRRRQKDRLRSPIDSGMFFNRFFFFFFPFSPPDKKGERNNSIVVVVVRMVVERRKTS